jgi:translocator protein
LIHQGSWAIYWQAIVAKARHEKSQSGVVSRDVIWCVPTSKDMNMKQWLVLAGFVGLCLAVGGIGGFATSQSVVDWYPTLNKPSWTPPGWLFGPVWTLLYVMMGVAAWLVWKARDSGVALGIFAVQLALNMMWSLLFFGLKSPGAGLVCIVLLWAAIAATIVAFRRKSGVAALLLLPYLAWVSFATALNTAIVTLN